MSHNNNYKDKRWVYVGDNPDTYNLQETYVDYAEPLFGNSGGSNLRSTIYIPPDEKTARANLSLAET